MTTTELQRLLATPTQAELAMRDATRLSHQAEAFMTPPRIAQLLQAGKQVKAPPRP